MSGDIPDVMCVGRVGMCRGLAIGGVGLAVVDMR